MSGGDEDYHYLYRLMRGLADPAGVGQPAELGVIDLGHDVMVMFTVRGEDGARVGLLESHRTPDGRECGGGVTFDVPGAEGLKGARWTVESWEPLTLAGSVLCSCGNHGFIRGGRWIPA